VVERELRRAGQLVRSVDGAFAVRLFIAVLTLCCLWARPALPCTQVYLLGATAPADGDLWPTDGDLWLHYGGPEDGIVAILQRPGDADIDLVLTRVDADLVQANLPTLAPNSDYIIRIETESGLDAPRQIHFRSAEGPINSPAVLPQWSAGFDMQVDDPCSNSGLYVDAEIPGAGALHTVAWRLFDAADMRPLGSHLATDAEFPLTMRRWVMGGRPAIGCVVLSAVRANGQSTMSPEQFCFPPRTFDAGVIDSGTMPDAGGGRDADLPRPDAGPMPSDAGPMPEDAGQPAVDAGPTPTTPGGGLNTDEGGCGCTAGEPAHGAGYPGGLLGLLAVLIVSRCRRKHPIARP